MARPQRKQVPPISERDRQRFLAKLEHHPSGCWLWKGSATSRDYGLFSIQFDTEYGRATGMFTAHRVSYVLHKGAIPAGMDILHSCDRGRCINPEHLRPGTSTDNERDKTERNRRARGGRTPGIRIPRESFTISRAAPRFPTKTSDAQVRAMRERYAADLTVTASALAKEAGMAKQSVLLILRGRSRKRAGGPISEIRRIIGARVTVQSTRSGSSGRRTRPEDVPTIRALYAQGPATMEDLARQFNISLQTVSKIIRREGWKHVPESPDIALIAARAGFTKLTREQVTKIRQRYAAGAPQHRLAADYRVSRATISMLVNRKTHAGD